MRTMMIVSIPTTGGNRGAQDGSLPGTVQGFLDKAKPEAAYFGLLNGVRTGFFVFDLASPADIPLAGEPFFQAVDANITMLPVMDAADLTKGLGALQGSGLMHA